MAIAANPRHYFFVGRDYSRMDLRGKDLRQVNFTCANLRGADLSGADCRGAIFVSADLSRACLQGAHCGGADFSAADLTNSYLRGVNFTLAVMTHCVLKGAICKNANFESADLTGADIARAEMLGARFDAANVDSLRNIDWAIFRWFLSPEGGKPSYHPFPGAVALSYSLTGKDTYQENAGMGVSGRGYLEKEMELP
jgi:hypothetical protein